MSKRIWIIIAVLSLLFNIGFVASFLYHDHQIRSCGMLPPQEGVESVEPMGPPKGIAERNGTINKHHDGHWKQKSKEDFCPPEERGVWKNRLGSAQTRAEWRKKMYQQRVIFQSSRLEFIKELAKPDFDSAKARTIMATSVASQNQMEKLIGTRLIDLRNKMTAKEAKEFFGKRSSKMENAKKIQEAKMNKWRKEK